MDTVTETARPVNASRRPRKPEPRSVRVLVPLNEFARNGVVQITKGKLAVSYFLDREPSDYGEAFALTKVQGEDSGPAEPPYHVLLNGTESSCECPGFLRWGTECKHLGCCRKLKELGKLPTPAAGDDPRLEEYKPAGHAHGLPF